MPNRSYPQFTTRNNQRCGGHVTICTIKQYTNKTKHYRMDAERSYPQFTTCNNQRCGGHVEEYDIHRGGRKRLVAGEAMGSDQMKQSQKEYYTDK